MFADKKLLSKLHNKINLVLYANGAREQKTRSIKMINMQIVIKTVLTEKPENRAIGYSLAFFCED